MEMEIMAAIQYEKKKEISSEIRKELDEETGEIARGKRESFDIPINAVKVDPLR